MKGTITLLLSAFIFVFLSIPAAKAVFAKEGRNVLIIQDELPQMKILAEFLRHTGKLNVSIVHSDSLPADLNPYQAVIVFIHRKLSEQVEVPLIEYTKNGGRFIGLHHTISSQKRKNKFFFNFLGLLLFKASADSGGYAYREGITLELVNLNPKHYITSHNVKWDGKTLYRPSDFPSVEKQYPTIQLHDTEAYLNHTFTDGREKTVLCGIKFYDAKSGKWYMQDRGAWFKKYGKGFIFYFMPGHRPSDFENRNMAQMVLNAILWQGQ